MNDDDDDDDDAGPQFSLPIPHIYNDGDVLELKLVKHARYDEATIWYGDHDYIVIGSKDHALALARTLLIAAKLWNQT